VKTSALAAGTPVAYGRIVEWKGRPEADIFWGGESALFDKLAEQKLLAKLDLPKSVVDSIPDSIGKPRPVRLENGADPVSLSPAGWLGLADAVRIESTTLFGKSSFAAALLGELVEERALAAPEDVGSGLPSTRRCARRRPACRPPGRSFSRWTFHFSFAYLANSASAGSVRVLATGVMRTSSHSRWLGRGGAAMRERCQDDCRLRARIMASSLGEGDIGAVRTPVRIFHALRTRARPGDHQFRAIVFERARRGVRSGAEEFRQHFPAAGWSSTTREILRTQIACARAALEKAKLAPDALARSASPTSARPRSCEDRRTGNPSTAPSSGRTGAPPRAARR